VLPNDVRRTHVLLTAVLGFISHTGRPVTESGRV
jgi:hypothetical protein